MHPVIARPRDTTELRAEAPAGTDAPAARGAGWVAVSLECGASLLAAAAFLSLAGNVDVNPMSRVGQVAGLATLQFRFAVVCVVVVVALLLAERYLAPPRRALAVRLACAIFAGLASGLVAAGVRVALHGTPWALYVGNGDGGWISQWVDAVQHGGSIPAHYPPLSIYLSAAYQSLTGKPFWLALRDFQLVGTALFGPAAYLSWRLLLRAPWALGIGVLAGIALINPLKPYPQLTLVVFLPLVVKFLQVVRGSATLSMRRAAILGVVFGLAFALLFLLYSGWFVWAALGVVAAFAGLVPWRDTGRGRPALVLAGVAAAVFVLVGWIHLRGLLSPSGALSDRFFYFDTDTEPTYVAMWRDDAPGNVGVWPPPGELAGLGLFTVLLAAGLAVALAVGWRRTIVIGIGACLVSAWLMRMWLASESYRTWSVRLYPRTTMLLFYGLVVLTGFAVYLVTTALARRTGWVPGELHRPGDPPRDRGGSDRAVGPPLALLLCPVLLLLASAGSATADRYMPRNEKGGTGYYAWVSQNTRLLSGQCPLYTRYTTPSCEIPAPAAPGAVAPAPAVPPTPAVTPPVTPTPAILPPPVASPTPATGQLSPSRRR